MVCRRSSTSIDPLSRKQIIMSNTQNPVSPSYKQEPKDYGNQSGSGKREATAMAQNAEGVLRDVGSEFREGAGQAVDAAKEALSRTKDSVKQRVAKAQEQAAGAMNSFKDHVSDNPLVSIGIAAGVGVIIGVLIARPRS